MNNGQVSASQVARIIIRVNEDHRNIDCEIQG